MAKLNYDHLNAQRKLEIIQMTFPQEIAGVVAWVDQPTPAFIGDAHALHFQLGKDVDGVPIRFYGQLFYRPATETARFARLVGTAGPVQYQGDSFYQISLQTQGDILEQYGTWARLELDLSGPGLAFINLLQDSGDPLVPGAFISSLELEIANVDVFPDGSAVIGLDDGWVVYLRPQTVIY